ncbi:MAG: sugar phosphate nucleotidyltransferase [Nitrospirota bacterium]
MPNPISNLAETPVVILCGGKGIVIDDSGLRTNKALIQVAGHAIVTWVMRHYVSAGFRNFILATGFQSDKLVDMLKSNHGATLNGDVQSLLLAGTRCSVSIVTTPDNATTGDRLKACRPYLRGADYFCTSYSDTLSDVNLTELCRFHLFGGQIASLVAAEYPVRFRILGMRLGDDTRVRGFATKPVIEMAPINGGFYLFNHAIFDERYLGVSQDNLVLENEVLDRLSADGQLRAFCHKGRWQTLDCERDLIPLSQIAASIPT